MGTPVTLSAHTLPSYPLQDLSRQWLPFIEQAETSASLWQGSTFLKALAQETSARTVYAEAWKDYERDRDGMAICYSLCAALNDLTDASQCWARQAASLEEKLKQKPNDMYLHALQNSSVHQFRRISYMQLTVQSDIHDVAKAHKVLLLINVLESVQEENAE